MEPYSALIGRWRSTGTVYDEQGRGQTTMAGTDTYEWLPGESWVVHTIDVLAGDQPTRALWGRREGDDRHRWIDIHFEREG